MISKEYSEVAVEINVIFENMSKDVLERIPDNVLRFFHEIASKDYKFEYDKTKKLYEQKMRKKTKGIIALIYKDYICNEEEKKAYTKTYYETLRTIDEEKRKKYHPDNIFKNKKRNFKEENLPVVIEEESFFQKFIGKIKKILKKTNSH